jgi:hypothetical protein
MRDVALDRKEQTENNFAAIQDADQLVPRGFVVIDFYQFCEKVGWLNARHRANAMRDRPCCANNKKPFVPSAVGTSRCAGCIHSKSAVRCDKTRSRSKSSVIIGRGGFVRAIWGVNVLKHMLGEGIDKKRG